MKILLKLMAIAIMSLRLIASNPQTETEYVLIGWNDLGMHCANGDFSKIVVLPPWNTVRAQLMRIEPGQDSELVTEGITIDYSIPGNTWSVGKTNFWDYAQELFDLPQPLPDNIGLTGKGLSGQMDPHGDYFEAAGIPLTPFTDADLENEDPYQLILLEARDELTGELLASTRATVPVSNEIGCLTSGCHTSEQAILDEHPDDQGFDANDTPILCASCHASAALGTEGNPEAKSFSFRIHEKHHEIGPANSISTCYYCHPGPNTLCLRGVMATGINNPMICQDCHGTMDDVASSIEEGRVAWLDEPSCGTTNCHGSNFAEPNGELFREARGHGGLYCSACHGSPHAIYPSGEPRDNEQSIALQGHAGTLSDCNTCHSNIPDGPGPHGVLGPVPQVVDLSVVYNVAQHQVVLSWSPLQSADSYKIFAANEVSDDPMAWQLLSEQTQTGFSEEASPNQKRFYRVTVVRD
jgi:hypothetical protein